MAGAPAGPVPSPCTKLCMIDPGSGWCLGCGRTLEEIAGWGGADTGRQQAILARLADRLARLDRPAQ